MNKDIDTKLLDIDLSGVFVNLTPNARETKNKIKQMGLHQTKKLLCNKGNHQQNENQPT